MLPPPPPARRHVGGAPCGCCYAFGGMAGVEAANTLYTGELTTLSEQEIVSCDELDYGCDGGLVCVHVCVCVCVCVHVCVRVCGVLCWGGSRVVVGGGGSCVSSGGRATTAMACSPRPRDIPNPQWNRSRMPRPACYAPSCRRRLLERV